MLKHVSSRDEFYELIKEGTVLVDFFATWCGPCKMLSPVLEQLSEEVNTLILKVDVDEVGVVLADDDIIVGVFTNHQVSGIAYAVAVGGLAHAVDGIAVWIFVAQILESVNHFLKIVTSLLGKRERVDVAAPFQRPSLLLNVTFLSETFGDLYTVVGHHVDFTVHPALQLAGLLCRY